MHLVNWFEIPATDLERAKAFYEAVLDVELAVHDMGPLKMAMFPMMPGASGAAGALVAHEEYTPSHSGSMVYFSVPDIEATLAKAAAAGGKILFEKKSIGEYGFFGHAEDSEGNRIGLHAMT